MNTLLTRCGSLFLRCRSWIASRFGGTEPALCQLGAVVGALVIGTGFAATYWPQGAGYAVTCAAALAALELAFWLARKLLRLTLGRSLGWLPALGLLLGSIAHTVWRGAGEGWTYRVWLFAAAVTALLWLLAASWSLAAHDGGRCCGSAALRIRDSAAGGISVYRRLQRQLYSPLSGPEPPSGRGLLPAGAVHGAGTP